MIMDINRKNSKPDLQKSSSCGCAPAANIKKADFNISGILNKKETARECAPGAPEKKVRDDDFVKLDISGVIETPAGKIPVISSTLTLKDYAGTIKARFNINRNNYKIRPGLYALGNPDSASPVLVTANYKLTFDSLRKELARLDAWILVLNTEGINVWCAAGKGTFGTQELIKRIKITDLENIVAHRKLVVPQLGATGVAAHKVKEGSGFNVIFGPVKSGDIVKFLESGFKADDSMRRVKFTFIDRLILIPVEISLVLRYLLILVVVFFILSGISPSGFSFDSLVAKGPKSALLITLSMLSGAAITPLLLPFIPGRAFAFKGLITGAALFLLLVNFYPQLTGSGRVENFSWLLLITSISSFLAMNFTGSTTFTSLSGVIKEMRIALPLQIAGAVSGLVMWIISIFL